MLASALPASLSFTDATSVVEFAISLFTAMLASTVSVAVAEAFGPSTRRAGSTVDVHDAGSLSVTERSAVIVCDEAFVSVTVNVTLSPGAATASGGLTTSLIAAPTVGVGVTVAVAVAVPPVPVGVTVAVAALTVPVGVGVVVTADIAVAVDVALGCAVDAGDVVAVATNGVTVGGSVGAGVCVGLAGVGVRRVGVGLGSR